MKRWLIALGLLVAATAGAKETYRTLDWGDLVPPGATFQPPIIDHQNPFAPQQSSAVELVKELNGQKVRIPGFVVPLEGDERTLTSFILVPYFGACIHVPPPPPNQLVHVDFPSGAPVNDLWDAVWISGTIKTIPTRTEVAVIGYTMDGVKIERYEDFDEIEIEDPWQ